MNGRFRRLVLKTSLSGSSQKRALEGYGVDVVLIRFRRGPPIALHGPILLPVAAHRRLVLNRRFYAIAQYSSVRIDSAAGFDQRYGILTH